MINIKFYINTHNGQGVRELPIKPLQGNSDVSRLNEELDSGFMILWLKNSQILPIMSYINYEISDGETTITREFYISDDKIEVVSKNKLYYQHNIELIELTKELEKKYTGTLCFTQPSYAGRTRYYLSDCLERILKVFELNPDTSPQEGSYYNLTEEKPPFPYDSKYNLINKDFLEKIKNIPAPQLVFHNPTLREALDGVLKYVSAVVRINSKITLNQNDIKFNDKMLKTYADVHTGDRGNKIVLRIKALEDNNNFVIDWGHEKLENPYTITKIVKDEIYVFEKEYEVEGIYTIKLPSDLTYEFIGDKDSLLPSFYGINTETNRLRTICPNVINNVNIGDYAFYTETTFSENIKFEGKIQRIGNYAFYNWNLYNDLTEEVVLPYTITEIGEYAFAFSWESEIDTDFLFTSKTQPILYSTSFENRDCQLKTFNNYIEGYNTDSTLTSFINFIGEEKTTKIKINVFDNTKVPYLFLKATETNADFRIYWDGENQSTLYDSYSVVENELYTLSPTNLYSENKEYIVEIPYNQKYDLISPIFTNATVISTEINGKNKLSNTFEDCNFLEEVILSEEIEEIEEYAFKNCYALKSIKIPDKITTLSSNLFYNTTSLESVNFSNVRLIKEYCFYNSGLQQVVLNYGLISIEQYAFSSQYLEEIYIPRTVLYIYSNSINGYNQTERIYFEGQFIPSSWETNWTLSDNVYVCFNSFVNRKEISGSFLSEKKNNISNKNLYKDDYSKNIESYNTNTISFVKNVVSEEKYGTFNNIVQYPSTYPFESYYNYFQDDMSNSDYPTLNFYNESQNYTLGRLNSDSNNYSVNDSNFGITTNFNIQSVVNLQIFAYIDNYTGYGEDIYYLPTKNLILNIQGHILEEEAYNNLPNIEKNYYGYYKKGDNFVNLSGSYKLLVFTQPSFYNIIGSAFVNFLNATQTSEYHTTQEVKIKLRDFENNLLDGQITVKIFYDGNSFGIDGNLGSTFDTDDLQKIGYRISYIPITNLIISQEKEKIQNNSLYATNNVNQEDRIVSYTNFGNTLHSLAQRTGNETKEIVKLHKKLSDVYNVGDYYRDYIITVAEYIYYDNYIIGKYSLDKEYNRISNYMGVNADIRQYEIPTNNQTYEREILIKNYCYVGYENDYTKPSTCIFYNRLAPYFMFSLGGMKADSEVDFIHIKPLKYAYIHFNDVYEENKPINQQIREITNNNITTPFIRLPCYANATKNCISFSFKFEDNISAGSFVEEADVSFFGDKYLKHLIPYAIPVNSNNLIDYSGCLRNLQIMLGTDGNSVESKYLPLINEVDLYTRLYETRDLLVLKDSSEILKFTYQLNFIVKSDRIMFGNSFFEDNYILKDCYEFVSKNREYNKLFYLYLSNEALSNQQTTNVKEFLDKNHSFKIAIKNFNNNYFNCNITNNYDFYLLINKDSINNYIRQTTKALIITDEYGNLIMQIKYNSTDVDGYGENYLYKPIYFNFKDKRSDIKYDY